MATKTNSHRSRPRHAKKHGRHAKRNTAAKRNPVKYITRWRVRNAAKKNRFTVKKRNPGGESTGSLIQTSLFGAGGAVLSRMIPQWVLGGSNAGMVGYAANVVAGLTLAWAGRKFISRAAGNAALAGAGIALVLRLVQDWTPWGGTFNLQGVGDPGMGILMPSSYVDPALFTGNGAQRRIPPAWQPPPAAPVVAKGMAGIPSTYGFSTYGR